MKKRWVLIFFTILFLWVLVSRFTQLQQLKTTLEQARWAWLLAALLVQAVYYTVFSASYQAAFSTVGIQTRTRDLIPLTLGSLFVNLVVPAGGAGGAALFAENLARRGKPPAGAAAGVLLQFVADLFALSLLLIPALIYLFVVHALNSYEILAAAVLLLIASGLAAILLFGFRKPDLLRSLFGWTQSAANRLFGRMRRSFQLADDWADRNAREFNQAAAAAAIHPARLALTIGIALLAHCLNIISLFVLFLAFRQPVGPGTLVTGYAVGILFWVTSIVPQGIGVVEGVMALTFTSLGIPGAVAATVALVFRGLVFWLPMLLGFIAVQRLSAAGEGQRFLTEKWGVRFAAVMVSIMGIINLLSAVTPAQAGRLAILAGFSPLEVRHGGRLTAALAGFALLLLARNLWRRKRVAWLLAVFVLGFSAIGHLLKGLDYEEALLAGGLVVMLWRMRAHFHAHSDPPSMRQGLRVLAGSLLFTLVYGVTGFYLLDRHFSVNFSFWGALRQTVVMFTQFYDPGLVPITGFGRYFAGSIYLVGAVTFGYAIIMLLRPVFIHRPATPAERERARTIVERNGRSSLVRALLFDDKRYFFSPGGSVIGYMLVGRTAVALGDPVGPEGDRLASIRAYRSLCERNDWLAVFYQTLPETLDLYRQAGYKTLRIGDEGIVNLGTFSLEGKLNKPLRNAFNKLAKAGYQFCIYTPPIPDDLLVSLRAISDEWLATVHGSEKRFSLGWFDDAYIRGSSIGAVYTPEGWISAFANIVPEFQANEISIDLMRHRREIENGTMEFLFVSLFRWAQAQGYATFNLGLSSLSGVGEQAEDPAAERILHFIYEHVNQFYNFKGLHAFKEKFHPDWSPRYLVYPDASQLAQAALAVVQANSGSDGLLSQFLK